MFRGRYEHILDEKGRIAVPSRYREALGTDAEPGTLVITNLDQCLIAYPWVEWQKLESRLAALEAFDAWTLGFLRYFVSGAVECPIDKAGRILIPPGLREFAGISQDCVFAGQISRFEIWAKDRWDAHFALLSDQFTAITERLSQKGLSL